LLLSDVLGAEVRDGRGQVIGRVQDVRLEQELTPEEGLETVRVTGFLVGPAPGRRFGMNRPDVKGPLLIKWIARWIYGRLEMIDWDQIESLRAGSIEVRKSGRSKRR
jgi:sporulation protein YlmC with PRC-barrel domain